MNTSALKSFAQQARTLLREGVERRLIYWGFDKSGKNTAAVEAVTGGYTFRGKVNDDTSVPAKWNKLKTAIAQTSFDEVVEKAAYTWFNRLIAMRILSKSGYETAQLDYLSDEPHTPAILERARRGQYSFLTAKEQQRIRPLLTEYEKEQEAFAILLIGYCHQHSLLHSIFGAIDDYTELLLPDDILTENGFLFFLNTTDAITDDDHKQVELIGWLYQFYISEKKDEVFASFKQNKKAEAKDIPAATQIFTPNWIVKYLVQNTLGRTWLDIHPDSDLKANWKYLVEPGNSKGEEDREIKQQSVESLTFLDPAVGSGHILVEAFDTLYPMYMAEYYSPEEAVQTIIGKNVFGLDLDLRAVQLAQFALILKAAQYSRSVLEGKILPHIYAMPQHRTFDIDEVVLFLGKEKANYVDHVYQALKTMEQAHNLGSIMVLSLSEDVKKAVSERNQYWKKKAATNIDDEIVKEVFPAFTSALIILTTKYSCIAANPPYMGDGNMNAGLKKYVKENYSIFSNDLMTVFMQVANRMSKQNARWAIINFTTWMTKSEFANMREFFLENCFFESMFHLGRGMFGSDFGTVAFTCKKGLLEGGKTKIFRFFSNFTKVDSSSFKQQLFLEKKCFEFTISQSEFSKIPGYPFAYWLPKTIYDTLNKSGLQKFGDARQGIKTGENEQFLKYWQEIDKKHFSIFNLTNPRWFPVNKGGELRKWFGNNIFVMDWENNGQRIKNFKDSNGRLRSRPQNTHLFFHEGISWSTSARYSSFRYSDDKFTFESSGSMFFINCNEPKFIFKVLSFLNSSVGDYFLKVFSPGRGFSEGSVKSLPFTNSSNTEVSKVAEICVLISKSDWNSREISWDFQSNPLISANRNNLGQSYQRWLQQISKDFFQLHANEEELNRIFIEIYGLQEELTPDVHLRDITILQEELDYDALEQLQKPYEGQLVPVHADVVMQQLISYVVGCYMGRYRLDKPGLHIAHPNPTDEELSPYSVKTGEDRYFQFQIDDDAIVPIMGSNGNFTDDMLHRVKEFLPIIWGDDTLTANINFLQQQLDKNLEEYLIKDFWKYHVNMYSKKPIYWLFASKKGAFQILVYMHRMNAFTLAKIRSKYLIPHISWLQNIVTDMEKKTATLSKTELKKLDTYRKQLEECEKYDLLLKDMADKQITFDLDDGVTKNHELFKGVVAEIK